MAKKSAFENLNALMEDEGDINIDVTIVADADAEAAEDIVEVQEQTEAADEADQIVEQEEEAQQEAEDMAELAAILRKHGITPGMAAVLNVTMPLSSYGITMPALESMDSTGRNQALADRIAAGLEASSEGFWESTKKHARNLWEKIKSLFRWIGSKFGNILTRVRRAKKSLEGKTFDSERGKDKKFKALKKNEPAQLKACVSNLAVVATRAAGAFNSTGTITKAEVFVKSDIDVFKDGLGITFKSDGDGNYTSIEKLDDDFTKTAETDMNASQFDACKSDAWKAEEMAVAYIAAGKKAAALELSIKGLDDIAKINAQGDGKDASGDDKNTVAKNGVAAMRKQMGLLLKVQARCNKLMVVFCNTYVSACGVARNCAGLK